MSAALLWLVIFAVAVAVVAVAGVWMLRHQDNVF